jgi:fucose permease
MQPEISSSFRFLKFFLHAGFFLSGIATVLIGQILPILAERLELNDAQAGLFFTSQFSGSLIGTLLTNWFGKKNKFLFATIIGCFLMASGVLFLNFDSWMICLIGFFINGLGIGLTLPSINLLTLELNPMRATSALNVLNFFWGMGAIISQPFVDFTTRGMNLLLPTTILAAALASLAITFALIPKGIEKKSLNSEEKGDCSEAPIWRQPIAWTIAAFNFVHVGFESGMGGWLKTYSQRLENPAVDLLPPIFLYFLFFVVGRGVAPLFVRFLNDNLILLVNLVVVLLGMSVLLFADNWLFVSFGAAVAGFGTATIFPTNLSRFTKVFGASAIRSATPLFICGTLGAAFTTWLIGFASSYFNNLRSGMFVLAFSIAALVGLQIFLMFRNTERFDS